MSAAPVLSELRYPGGLTSLQWGTLAAIVAMRTAGHTGDKLDLRSVNALERRGLVERRGSPALTRIERWFATIESNKIVYDESVRGKSLRRITPSKRDPWEGAAYENSRFTAGQVLELDRINIDHRRVPLILVAAEVPDSELWAPAGQARPTRKYACPRIGLSRKPGHEGRVAILTPSGDWASCEADGSDPRLYAAKRQVGLTYGREAWL